MYHKLTSLSMLCIAGGAFTSIANQLPEIERFVPSDNYNNKNNNAPNNTLSKTATVSGYKLAKLAPLGSGMIGSSTSANTQSSDACYSNCYAEPISSAQRCINEGYKATSCDGVNFFGDTLSGVCPYDNSYYKTCVDCTSLKSEALDSTYDSGDMFAHDLDWAGTTKPVLATGITGSGPVSISTVPWHMSLNSAQMIINGTATDIKKYNDACNTNMTWSCYSNCHTESAPTCDEYLDSIGVKHASTSSEFLAITGESNTVREVAILDSFLMPKIPHLMALYGPKHYSASSSCQALETPTAELSSLTQYLTDIGDINIKTDENIYTSSGLKIHGNVSAEFTDTGRFFGSSDTLTVTQGSTLNITNSNAPSRTPFAIKENATLNIDGTIDGAGGAVSNLGTLNITAKENEYHCISSAVISTSSDSTINCKSGKLGALGQVSGTLLGKLNIDTQNYKSSPLINVSTGETFFIKGDVTLTNVVSDISLYSELAQNSIYIQDGGSITNSSSTANLIFDRGLNLGSDSLLSGFNLTDDVSSSSIRTFTASAGARVIKDGVCKKAPTSTDYTELTYASSWVSCENSCSTYQSSPWVVNGSTVYSLCQAYGLIPSSTTETCGGTLYTKCQAPSSTPTCTTSAASCITGYTLCTGYSALRCMADTSTGCNCFKTPPNVSVSYTEEELCKYCNYTIN